MRLAIVLAAAISVVACDSSCKPAAGPSGPCGATTGDDVCILPHVASDVVAGMQWADILLDVQSKCGDSPPEIEQTWAAHVAAEVAEGIVPRMPIPDGGH